MVVTDFVRVDAPMIQVQEQIAGSDGLAGLATAAHRKGEELTVGPGKKVAAAVDFSMDTPVIGSNSVTFPIRWTAIGPTSLFPVMDAELVLSEMGTGTHIEFRGVYTPPLGGVGYVLDRLALHRVAEATVRSFLDTLVSSLSLTPAV